MKKRLFSRFRYWCLLVLVFLCVTEITVYKFVNFQDDTEEVSRYNKVKPVKIKDTVKRDVSDFRNGVVKRKYVVQKPFNCTLKAVHLSKSKLPLTGLLSCPGSGNTWVRHLIQQLTGLGTSSMDCDVQLKKRGFPFECETHKERTIAVKSHYIDDLNKFKKVILVVRNPFDTILSWASFSKGGHTGHPSKVLLKQAVAKMFNSSLAWYVDIVNATVNHFNGPVHILQYSRLKLNISQELQELAGSLEVDVSPDDIECTIKLKEGNFHRRTSDKLRLDRLKYAFSEDQIKQMRQAGEIVKTLIYDAYQVKVEFEDPFD